MASENEKMPPPAEGSINSNLKGWKYRTRKIGPFKIPCYASPPIQLVIVSFVCFLCPGMFNALSGMGGGGQVDRKAGDDANVALYSTFAVVGFFAGSFVNRIGLRFALSFGGLGYCIYVASFLSYSHNKNAGFTVFAGALLGVCAGLLWTAQGAIMMSYPPEKSKGRYISWFWMIFNLGAVIGSLIPLGQNIHVKSNSTVTDGTYAGFLVLTGLGAVLAWFLVDAHKVVRHDGSRVILMKNPTWNTELTGLVEVFFSSPEILFMFPMFFASNFFYGYQFSLNGAKFTTRTKSLNNVLYWMMQIVGAYIFGYALDFPKVRRSVRAKASWIALFVLTFAVWGGGYAFQKSWTRKETDDTKNYPFMDWTSDGYIGAMFLYMFYGFYDAAFQTCVYWYMGAMTNNGRKLANFTGFYKGIQSAGAALMWSLDGQHQVAFIKLLAGCWGLLAGSLLVGIPLIFFKIRDTVPVEEDIKFSDETIEEVAGKEMMRVTAKNGEA